LQQEYKDYLRSVWKKFGSNESAMKENKIMKGFLWKRTLSRRGFIAKVSQGFVAANVAGAFLKEAGTKEAAAPDSPGRIRVGHRRVGHLAIHESCPLLRSANNPAYSSGERHPDKANKLAQAIWGESQNITTIRTTIRLRNDPKVDIIYIVLPNGMHANTQFADFKRANTC